VSKFTASKRRAKLLDPEARVAAEKINEKHPEWGEHYVIFGTNGRRLTGACTTISAAWKHASRRLDTELHAKQQAEMVSRHKR
jgi:hypothetical protein